MARPSDPVLTNIRGALEALYRAIQNQDEMIRELAARVSRLEKSRQKKHPKKKRKS